MVCLRLGVCAVALMLAVFCGRARSQDCEDTINITASDENENFFPDAMTRTCFVCLFGSPPTANSMTVWTLGGDPLMGNGVVVDEGVLVITTPGDTFSTSGATALRCSSPAGTISVFVQAVALVPPGVENMTVNETDTLTIICGGETSTLITSYRWTGPPNGTEVAVVRTLTIENIQRSQAGVYTCFITNFQGSEISASATVTVQYTPDVERLTPSPHLSPLGQTLSLSCSYDAIPTPSVTWMRDAEVLSDDNRTSVTLDTDSFSSELTLDELEREEGGVYVCLFTNEVGSGVSSIVVTVQVPPGPASELQVTDRSTETFDLSWVNPTFTGNCPLTGIRIEYQTSDGSDDVMARNIITVEEEATLRDLRPFTHYNISVLVSNDVGLSDPVSITERTDSELPEAPSITNLSAENSTALLLEWETPLDPATTAPFDSFLIRINEVGGASLPDEPVEDPGATSFVLAGLAKGTSYTVTVAARNEAGLGPFSAEDTEETIIDPPSPPQNVIVVPLTSRVLQVTWTPPQDSGGRDIANYLLDVREVGEAEFEEPQSLGAELREARITGREENTTYEVRLTAFSTIMGVPAIVMATTPPIGEPQALLVAPVANMITTSSVRLSWEDPGGVVNFYVVEFKLRIDDWANMEAVETMLVNGTTRMTTIPDLVASSTYEARIRTRNDNGDSEPSPPVTFETLPEIDVSGPVGVVTAGQSVTLTCSVVGGGVPANVQWFQGTNGQLPQGATVNGNQLIFADPQPEDSGEYTCSSRGETSSFTLTIEALPEIDVSGPVGVVTAGQSVTLTCSVVGGGVPANVQWFQGTNGQLPQGATVNGNQLIFADPQPEDSGEYTCSSRGVTSSFTLTIEAEPSEGISDTVIIIVAAVGGVALVIFLIVLTIACCYCCYHRRRNANKGVYTVKTKTRGNWIETSGGASSAAAGSNERAPARAPSFHIPADYTTHSSFNTLEKQNRIKRSKSPDPRPAQDGPRPAQGDVSYAQLNLTQPSADVRGSTGNVQYTQVSATAAPAASRGETGSPTFQYIAQESLGFPAPRYGNGTAASPEDFDMTWPDGSTPPHYSNTVV